MTDFQIDNYQIEKLFKRVDSLEREVWRLNNFKKETKEKEYIIEQKKLEKRL